MSVEDLYLQILDFILEMEQFSTDFLGTANPHGFPFLQSATVSHINSSVAWNLGEKQHASGDFRKGHNKLISGFMFFPCPLKELSIC